MKLKTYTKEIQSGKRLPDPLPKIRFCRDGKIILNEALCALLNAKVESGVLFHQDEENPDEWFISVGKENMRSFTLWKHEKSSEKLRFSSKSLSGTILKSWKITLKPGESYELKIAPKPVEGYDNLYAILTRSAEILYHKKPGT